jgi:hypothetical protein
MHWEIWIKADLLISTLPARKQSSMAAHLLVLEMNIFDKKEAGVNRRERQVWRRPEQRRRLFRACALFRSSGATQQMGIWPANTIPRGNGSVAEHTAAYPAVLYKLRNTYIRRTRRCHVKRGRCRLNRNECIVLKPSATEVLFFYWKEPSEHFSSKKPSEHKSLHYHVTNNSCLWVGK